MAKVAKEWPVNFCKFATAMRKKLFSGQAVRRLRERAGWTQAECAERLGISNAYLSQIETNQRPLTASVLVALHDAFGTDVTVFTSEDPERLASALREVLIDPVFGQPEISAPDIQRAAVDAPWLVRSLIDLHGAYRRLQDRLHTLDDTLGLDARLDGTDIRPVPFEQVRDFFQFIDNYVDSLDRAGEQLASQLSVAVSRRGGALADYLTTRHGVRVRYAPEDGAPMRQFDRVAKMVTLRANLDSSTHDFLLAHQIGLLEQTEAIDLVIDGAHFASEAACSICRIALLNYFAAAVLMPYRRFLAAARETRHDLERMGRLFGASIEQVAHRLSTLQRPGEEGIPVYFVKVDRAGNIVKRHSATRFQFARFGGACALWNVHEAFEQPDKILTQIAELPDGSRYLCLAKCVVKPRTFFGEPVRAFAIGLGTDIRHASEFVYSSGLDLKLAPVARIGVSCRICEREDCHQRAVPAIDRTIVVDPDVRRDIGYGLGRG